MRKAGLAGAVVGAAVAVVVVGAGTTPAQAHSPAGTRALVSASATISALRADLRAGRLAQQAGTTGCRNAKVGSARAKCNYVLATRSRQSAQALASTAPVGYGATELEQAYRLERAPTTHNTIVIVDAGAYPTLEADLAVYRAEYGLPSCTRGDGCFRQENYLGGPAYKPDPDHAFEDEYIAVETALDVEMASAACPACHITEIQLPSDDAFAGTFEENDRAARHFSLAVRLAHRQKAAAVSISYGYTADDATDGGTTAANMSVPGTAVYAATGDSAYNGPYQPWPSNLTTTIAAGGTSLYHSSTSPTGFTETAWDSGGSGCSPDLPRANGQPLAVAAACKGHRAAADLSAVGDLYTGVAVYDSYSPASHEPYHWLVIGGTSVSSPLLAGMNARAGVGPGVNGPNVIYQAPAYTVNDVTLGSNAVPGSCAEDGYSNKVCVAGQGWDGPSGIGTPKGLAPFYRYQ